MNKNPPDHDLPTAAPLTIAEWPVAAPRSSELTFDLPCPRCGYNLRGLRENARCPECAIPVELVISGDLLVLSDRAWVAKIERGAACSRITSILAKLWIGIAAWNMADELNRRNFPYEIVAAGIASFLIAMLGVWWLTSPNLIVSEARSAWLARVATRCCVLVCALDLVAQLVAWSAGAYRPALLILSPIGIPGLLGTWTFDVHLRMLCRRTSRPDVETRVAGARNVFTIVWFAGPLILAGTLLSQPINFSVFFEIAAVVWLLILGGSGAILLTAPAALRPAICKQRRRIAEATGVNP